MKLVLVRHSKTIINPEVVSTEWKLSDEGRVLAEQTAGDSVFQDVDAVYSSSQPKAIQTAEIIAGKYELDNVVEEGLAELSSITRGFIDDYAGTVHKLYTGEIKNINGGETIEEALGRFNLAIGAIALANPNAEKVAVVTHANVLSLFSAQYCNAEAIDLHNSIRMPDIAVLDWTDAAKSFDRFWGEVA